MFNKLLLSDNIKNNIVTTTFRAKEQILTQGDISTNIYFIKKGCLRLWHLTEDGKDITVQFFFENSYVAVLESFYLNKPSDYNLQALENCIVYKISKENFIQFLKSDINNKDLFIDVLFSKVVRYNHLFLSRIKNSPEKLYLELLEKEPNLLNRIQDHYIASYLGITAVSFSRIKKRFS